MNIFSKIFNYLLAHRLNCKSKHRDIFCLLQHSTCGVIKTGNKIPGFIEDGRAAGAQQRIAHFLGNGLQAALDYGCQYSVCIGLRLHSTLLLSLVCVLSV